MILGDDFQYLLDYSNHFKSTDNFLFNMQLESFNNPMNLSQDSYDSIKLITCYNLIGLESKVCFILNVNNDDKISMLFRKYRFL